MARKEEIQRDIETALRNYPIGGSCEPDQWLDIRSIASSAGVSVAQARRVVNNMPIKRRRFSFDLRKIFYQLNEETP